LRVEDFEKFRKRSVDFFWGSEGSDGAGAVGEVEGEMAVCASIIGICSALVCVAAGVVEAILWGAGDAASGEEGVVAEEESDGDGVRGLKGWVSVAGSAWALDDDGAFCGVHMSPREGESGIYV